jgi:hypothetical protein
MEENIEKIEKRRARQIEYIKTPQAKEKRREYIKLNAERIAEIQKEYRNRNSDRLREQKRMYYRKNRERLLENAKKYQSENYDPPKAKIKYSETKETANQRRKELYLQAKIQKAKQKESWERWKAANPEKVYDVTFTCYLKKYKMTPQDYYNMLEEQKGVCAICGKPETRKHNVSGKLQRLSVDHCHNSNKVRSLLCAACNIGLGQFRDNIQSLESAISYLKRHTQPVVGEGVSDTTSCIENN